MARTSRRRAGGLSRVPSRQARLAIQFAKRLVRQTKGKQPGKPIQASSRIPGE
jgi:hypothetical protein